MILLTERKIVAYFNKGKDQRLVFVKGGDLKLAVYVDATRITASKENDRRPRVQSSSNCRGIIVNASSTTQHYAMISRSESE